MFIQYSYTLDHGARRFQERGPHSLHSMALDEGEFRALISADMALSFVAVTVIVSVCYGGQ
jgi:hypothetical protein